MHDTQKHSGGTPAPNTQTTTSLSGKSQYDTKTIVPESVRAEHQQPGTTQLYFKRVIHKYVLPDLTRLTEEIRPDEHGLRGCTVPLAMMLFAVADVFGFLLREIDSGTDLRDALKQSGRNVRKFFKLDYFDVDWGLANAWSPEKKAGAMWEVFRCGLAHEVFPKACGIAKPDKELPLIYFEDNAPVLNVDVLSEGVVNALKTIEADVILAKDPAVLQQMDTRLSVVFKNDREARERYFY
jgi:hypothetical protein